MKKKTNNISLTREEKLYKRDDNFVKEYYEKISSPDRELKKTQINKIGYIDLKV